MSLALVQCQECRAWRQLAEAPACADKWCCWMHPDPFLFTCGDTSSNSCLPQPCSTDSLGSMADVFYMQPISEPSSPTASTPTPDDWVRCNDCNRWRRLPSDVAADTNLDQWCCAMHPDPLCRSCKQTPAAALRTPKHFGFWESPALRTSTASAGQQKHMKSLSGAIDFLQRQAGNLL